MGSQRVLPIKSATERGNSASIPKRAGISLSSARAGALPEASRAAVRADLVLTKAPPGRTTGTVAPLQDVPGFSFARLTIHPAQHSPALPARQSTPQGKIDGEAVRAIAQSRARSGLPKAVRARLEVFTGHSFAHIAVHDDSAAQYAADLLGSRAFTL